MTSWLCMMQVRCNKSSTYVLLFAFFLFASSIFTHNFTDYWGVLTLCQAYYQSFKRIDNGSIFQVILKRRGGGLNGRKDATFINKYENKGKEGDTFTFCDNFGSLKFKAFCLNWIQIFRNWILFFFQKKQNFFVIVNFLFYLLLFCVNISIHSSSSKPCEPPTQSRGISERSNYHVTSEYRGTWCVKWEYSFFWN